MSDKLKEELTYKSDDGKGYACDDAKYSGAVALLRRLAQGGSGYGVDMSDLDPRPLQVILDALATSQGQVRELEEKLAVWQDLHTPGQIDTITWTSSPGSGGRARRLGMTDEEEAMARAEILLDRERDGETIMPEAPASWKASTLRTIADWFSEEWQTARYSEEAEQRMRDWITFLRGMADELEAPTNV